MILSIIIPAYNVERYIDACLQSVFSLPLSEEEMEVIVVDDGSTDQTPQLLQSWAEKHPNLRLLHQHNQGQSVARNWAIEEAKGDYIYMVDSDDAVSTLQEAGIGRYKVAFPVADLREGSHDIIGLQVLFKDLDRPVRPYSHQTLRWPFDQEYALGKDFLKTHNVEGLVYGYCFRRSLFVHHPELRFTPGIYHQDEELIVKAFLLAGPTVYREGYTYIYYKRPGSSIHTATTERHERLMNDMMTVMDHLFALAAEGDNLRYMRCKLRWLTFDQLRILIRQRHRLSFAWQTICRMAGYWRRVHQTAGR